MSAVDHQRTAVATNKQEVRARQGYITDAATRSCTHPPNIMSDPHLSLSPFVRPSWRPACMCRGTPGRRRLQLVSHTQHARNGLYGIPILLGAPAYTDSILHAYKI